MSLFPSQDSFVRGEISPRLHSRASLDLYRSALARCENFITLPHGGLRKRGGTRFVAPVKYEDAITRGIPFRYSALQAYWLEFGDTYCRVYAYGGFVVEFATPWEQQHLAGLQYAQSGDVLWIVHPDLYPRKITRESNTTWTVSAVEFTDGPFGPVNFDEAVTVYASAATGTVTLTANAAIFSSADVTRLFRIEMESYEGLQPWEPQERLPDDPNINVRYDGNVYAVEGATIGTRFGSTPPTHLKGVEPDGPRSHDPALDDIVGVNLRYLHSGFGVARITAVAGDGLSATATVISRFPDEVVGSGNAAYLWAFDAFASGDNPRAVAVFEERLFFATKRSVYGSKTGDFDSFRVGEKDDDALEFLVGAGETNEVVWLADADGYLAIGTTGGVRSLSGGGVDEPLTPSSFKNRSSATARAARVQPAHAGTAFLYLTGSGFGVAEMIVNQAGRFETADLFLISEHLPKQAGGFVAMALQERPDPMAWTVGNYGELAGLTLQRDQEVRGAHRHRIAGAFGDYDYARVVDGVATPGQGDADDVWLIVKRRVNGVERQFIEILTAPFEYGEQADAFALDCGLSYEGAPVGTVTGMGHLAGETVTALADGVAYEGLTVSGGGAVTLPNGVTASTIHVGLPLMAEAETLELDIGGRDGSLMGRRKRVSHVYLSVLETDVSRLEVASKIKGRWEPVKMPNLDRRYMEGELFTGTLGPVPVDDSWQGQGKVKIRHSGALPCTIRAMVPAFDSEGQG